MLKYSMSSDDRRNLRTFLADVVAADGVVSIDNHLSPELEVPEVLWEYEGARPTPIVWFDDIEDLTRSSAAFPVVANVFGDREWCANALNSSIEDVGIDYHEMEQQGNQREPIVEADGAPVQDIVESDDPDLRRFPLVTHHEDDAGPYITAGVCVLPPPPGSDWGYNAATLRLEYRDPDELGLFMIPGRHSASYFEAYEEAGENMPIAIVIGHHPTFHFGSQTLHSIDVDEYSVVGGVRNSPLRVTPSTTWDENVLIPADAEIVIEGEVVAGEQITEGPFGEYTGYYGAQSDDRHKIRVEAIEHRSDAIYHDIFAGHADHLNLGGIPIEGRIYESVKETISTVENVYLPPSGNCRQHCYVQIDKRKRGQGKNAIVAALAPYDLVKHVIVVDDDVDIFDDRDILWAIATRSQWDEDLIVESGFSSITLDPSAEDYEVTARGGIDATQELDAEYPDRLSPKGFDVTAAVDSATKLDSLPPQYADADWSPEKGATND
jgi:2,5-furandicarboxylate decarboxylase 1